MRDHEMKDVRWLLFSDFFLRPTYEKRPGGFVLPLPLAEWREKKAGVHATSVLPIPK